MARVLAWAFEPLDMRNPAFFFTSVDSEVTGNSSSVLNLQLPSGNRQSFSGSFQYEIDPDTGEEFLIGGTIVDLAETTSQFGQLYWLSELTLSVDTWLDFLLSDDREGLNAYVFAGNDVILGSHQDDVLVGYAGNDLLDGKIGNDTIDGGLGTDTVPLRQLRSQYQVTKDNGKIVVTDLLGTYGTDTLYDVEILQFQDVTIVINNAPVMAVANIQPLHAQTIAGNNLYASLTDADGEAIAQFRFIDHTAGNGRFWLNGMALAEQQEILITAAHLASFEYRSSVVGGDQISVQASDGYSWSDWHNFAIAAAPNAAPVAAAAGSAPSRGVTAVAASSLFSVSDGDGDTMSRYRFFDGTSGNGHFALSGATQATLANIEITAAQLASMQFVLGAPGASDTLWVQAFDGFVWSSWTSFNVTAPQNAAPVASINAASLNPAKGVATVAAASFFSATDPDSDPITQYRFFDGTAGNGRFELSGAPQVELQNITISAADLANFRFRTGTSGSDTLWVQAYDGVAWSAWKSFDVAAPVNVAPTVNVQTLSPAKADTFIAGSALFTVTDPDDAAMTQYRFFDGTAGNGYFTLDGTQQATLANIAITAAQLANFRYETSTTGAGDTLWVQAYDGIAWGAWKSFMVAAPVNVAPTVNVQNLSPAKADTFIAGSALFTVTDPDDAATTKYRFFDGTAGNGRFQLNGANQVELSNIEITAGDLANFRYATSTTGTGDTLWVQAYDGVAWSAWKSFDVAAPVNVAPTVNVQTLSPAKADTFIAGSALFTVTDPDDAAMAQYRFFDGTAGNGYFTLNGAPQATLANITITAAQLANFRYETSTTGAGDTLWVQAYDGFAWGAWKSFMVAAPVNVAPTVFVENLVYSSTASSVAASTLLVVSDPDDANMVRYRFWDSEVGSGQFRLNGAYLPEQRNVEILAADLPNLTYTTPGYSRDTIWVQAFDGIAWSPWQTFEARAWNYGLVYSWSGSSNVTLGNPTFNDPPTVVVTNTTAQAGTAISISNLLSASDANGDAITAWRFRDTTADRGAFRIDGVVRPDFQEIEVMAGQLAAVEFLAGNTPGFNRITASAFDGTDWSDPKTFIINTLVPV